jgi:hypothetical protein
MGQQVAQLHDRYMMMMMIIYNIGVSLLLTTFVSDLLENL